MVSIYYTYLFLYCTFILSFFQIPHLLELCHRCHWFLHLLRIYAIEFLVD